MVSFKFVLQTISHQKERREEGETREEPKLHVKLLLVLKSAEAHTIREFCHTITRETEGVLFHERNGVEGTKSGKHGGCFRKLWPFFYWC
jgi:hypothetical protein